MTARAGDGRGPAGDVDPALKAFARVNRLTVEQAGQWWDAEPQGWMRTNAQRLHEARMTPEQAHELWKHCPDRVRADIGGLVRAGVMASIESSWLWMWAVSGLLDRSGSSRGGGGAYTAWVTAARRFIAATDGDQRMAAMCAAAGLQADELGEMWRNGRVSEVKIRAMMALRTELVPDFGS